MHAEYKTTSQICVVNWSINRLLRIKINVDNNEIIALYLK